ncbi:MAG: EF-P beta-lysylation protein EpmB [Planctomycetota bacterium]|nr:EF-P beta-lysylation protein EpmB [Planctomycetota bacterium]
MALFWSLILATILPGNTLPVEGSFEPADWRASLRAAYRSSTDLCDFLGVDPKVACPQAESDFPILAPREFVQRMEPGNPRDPLLLQVVSQSAELVDSGELDPVGELPAERHKGLLQKYDHRVLLILSGACAIHCRYCFRRNFPYDEAAKGRAEWQEWLELLQSDSTIEEVIFSGGDPLSVGDDRLSWFIQQVSEIPHIRRLRFHTRLPVVIPSRVTPEFTSLLESVEQAVYVVMHINHAQELDESVWAAIRRLHRAGTQVLNQAVLLRGINDNFEALRELCVQLADRQVLPYYLHQLDPVRGGVHFGVPDAEALELVAALRADLPGYAVPRLVRELSGEASKTLIH